jgi:hypothetical protein
VGSAFSAALALRVSGAFDVSAAFTAAPDYGVAQLAIDGAPVGSPQDLFSPKVRHSGRTPLGRLSLPAGPHVLGVTIVGQNPDSTGCKFGLDWIEFTPVK